MYRNYIRVVNLNIKDQDVQRFIFNFFHYTLICADLFHI